MSVCRARDVIGVDWICDLTLLPSSNHSEQDSLRSLGGLLILRAPKCFFDSFLHTTTLKHLHPVLTSVLCWRLVLQNPVGYDEIIFDYV